MKYGLGLNLLLLINSMKNLQIFSLTSAGTLLFTEGSQVRQGTFEGLTLATSISARFALKNILFKSVECSLAKGGKIRCKDISFLNEILESGAATIADKEMQESKVFDQQQKDSLRSKVPNTEEILQKNQENLIDYSRDRAAIRRQFKVGKNIEAKIEALDEEILVSYEENQKTIYLPIKMKNVDHYFHLIDNVEKGQFLKENSKVNVTLSAPKFNLVKKSFEVQAQFPQQTEKTILRKGWGTLSIKNLSFLKMDVAKVYRNIQFEARSNHLGIFKKPFEILSLIYTKNNVVGKVQKIVEGYIIVIRTKNDEQMKIELSKIYCPIHHQIGAFECRQFARKNLIGKEVNVFLKKDEGLNIQGSIVRFSDNKDVETLLIQNGYGFVKEELKGTMLSGKLQNLEKKAKQNKKGIHNEKKVGTQNYEDLTVQHSKKEKTQKKLMIDNKIKCLQNLEANEEGVVQSIIDANTYVIRADKSRKILRVRLDGVTKLNANPKLKEIFQLNNTIENFTFRNFNQRTVFLNLTDFDSSSNNFIGVVQIQGKGKQKLSFQEILLEEGLVYLSNTGSFDSNWIKKMEVAQQKERNIWAERVRNMWQHNLFDQQPKQFKGKISWVQNGELAYVQPEVVNEKLDFIYEQMNKEKLQPLKPDNVVAGYICGSEYLGQFCRAKILTVSEKSVYITFMDWGNRETVEVKALFEIPENLQYIPPLCCEVLLDIVKPLKLKKGEHLDKLREFMMEGECKIQKIFGNTVNIFTDKQEHLNHILVEDGMLKADLSKVNNETSRIHLEQVMENLRKNLIGIWDAEQDQEEIDELDYL